MIQGNPNPDPTCQPPHPNIMTELPGRLIQEFKEFEQDIDKVRLFLLTRFVESNFADYDWPERQLIIRRKIEETWKVHPKMSHLCLIFEIGSAKWKNCSKTPQ